MRRLRVATSLLLLAALAVSPAEGYSKKNVKALVKEFNQTPRYTRPEHLLLPVNFIEHEGRSYAYYLPRRFVRLARENDTFTIDDVKYKKEYLNLHLKSTRGAKLRLAVYESQPLTQEFLDETIPRVLSELFEFREPPPGSRFVGNTESLMVHLRGCNHLPEPGDRRDFGELAVAKEEGFRLCPVCFTSEVTLPIEGYGPLRLEAVERARLFELAFPPVDDPAVQAEFRQLGESILDNYPVETRGFDYDFKVLHSELPLAVSFPTGFVYASDKLLAAIEDPVELEFVVAHEIAHCEFRHDFPQGPFIVTLEDLERWFTRVRFEETEADLFAILYLTRGSDEDMVMKQAHSVLSKLQFSSESVPVEQPDRWSTHPSYQHRLTFLDPDRFELAESRGIFCGLDKNGETLARMQLIGRRDNRGRVKHSGRGGGVGYPYERLPADRRQLEYYFFLELTDLINKPVAKASGKLEDEGGNKVDCLSQLFHFPLSPGESGIIVLEGSTLELSMRALLKLDLNIAGEVKDWVRCDGQESVGVAH